MTTPKLCEEPVNFFLKLINYNITKIIVISYKNKNNNNIYSSIK